MGCCNSKPPVKPAVLEVGPRGYKLYGPSVSGESIACFKDGLLYRIVTSKNTWSFYNDTQEYEMHVQVRFSADSDLKAFDGTVESVEPDGAKVLSTVVYPGETVPFMSGTFDTFKCNMSAKPLSTEYRARVVREAEGRIQGVIAAVRDATRSNDVEELLSVAVRNRQRFVDLEFPPFQDSLSREGIDARRIPPIPWMSPEEYLPERLRSAITIFRGQPSHHVVDHGNLGDCWLMCAVSAAAIQPLRITRLFLHPSDEGHKEPENAVGAYRVTLNSGGWWTSLIVDNYLPVIGNVPYFAKTKSDPAELWVSLLEKAYAKLHGSYAAIGGGDAMHALQDLTGFPTYRFDTEWEGAIANEEKSAELFDQLAEYRRNEFLLCFNTPSRGTGSYSAGSGGTKDLETKYKQFGLDLGYTYSVVEVVKFPRKNNLCLCKIRNPWGDCAGWNGKWSAESEEWRQNSDIAQALGVRVRGKDGGSSSGGGDANTFWMEWEDVKKHFDGGCVCFMPPHWQSWLDYRIRGSFSGLVPSVVLEVRVASPVRMMLVLSQRDKRGLPATDPNSKYSAIMLSVSRTVDGRQVVHLNSGSDATAPSEKYTFSFARDHAMAYTFEPQYSPYLIIPRIYTAPEEAKSFTVGLISEQPVGHAFSCSFKALDASCKVFANYPKFNYEEFSVPLVESDYQMASMQSAPVGHRGTGLVF